MRRTPWTSPANAERHAMRNALVVKRLSLAESRPGMEPIVHGAQPRLEDVRVDLRRREIRVAQHHLDGPQVGAAIEQVRGERMADDMRAERFREPGMAAVRFQNFPE